MKKLMKILLLNPHIDAQHQIVQLLKSRGMALLMPSNAGEAWQVLNLHGTSVDLAVIHREGVQGGDPGVELLSKIKKDPVQADLAVLFTTEAWTPEQCASHQRTPMGANAYLSWPFDGTALLSTIDAVFSGGAATGIAPKAEAPAGSSDQTERLNIQPPKSGEFVLEEPAGIFAKGEPQESSIKLDSAEGAAPAIEISMPMERAEAPADATRVQSLKREAIPEVPQTAGPDDGTRIHDPAMEQRMEKEMPYLFSKGGKSIAVEPGAFSRAFIQPVGDAVIPGGAVNSPDTDTLKKYLMLREQDVAALSSQLKAARDELALTKGELASERSRSEDLQFKVEDQGRKLEDFEREKALALEGVQAELSELRFQSKAKTDKAKLLETQVNETAEQIERLKERVRSDIRKIRVRERELENKLEIAKKDSEAILAARENRIVELKRKLDLLEFNMDILQDRYAREKEASAQLREKLAKAAQVVRVAEGLLEPGPAGAGVASAPGDVESKAS